MADFSGFTRLTTSGVIGDSGKPIDVGGFAVTASGGTAAPTIMNGTAASSPVAFVLPGTATTTSSIQTIPLPVRLTNGCFVSFDANTSAVTVFYIQAVT